MLCAALELVGASVVAIFLHLGCQDVVRSCAPCFPCQGILTGCHWLPPRFRLNPIREPTGSVLEWDSPHQAAEAIGPVCVRHKQTQHWAAEELAARTDLGCNREFAQPAVELRVAVLRRSKAFRVVKPSLKYQGKVLSEKHFGSQTERRPVVEAVAWQAIALSLKNKNRHDRKSVVGLNEQVFREQQSLGAFYEGVRIIDRRAEIARCALPVLNGKRMVTAVPFQTLVAQSECVPVGGRNYRAGRRGTALGVRKIEPKCVKPKRPFEIVEADIDVVFRVVSVLRDDVGPRARQKRHRHFTDAKIPVLNTGAIAAHVQRIEIIDLDVLAPVVAFSGPELRIRLALQDVASAHKRFAQPELIVSRVARKICITRIIPCVGLDHHFCFHPGFVAVVLRVEPVVDENEFSISFCFVAQAIFRIRAGSLKRDLRSALAVEAITRPEIAVELKALRLLVQFLYLLVGLSEEVIGRLRGKLALKLCPYLIGLSEHRFLSCLLGSQLYRGDGALLTFLGGLFLFLDLLFEGSDALFKVAGCGVVLALELLKLLLQIVLLSHRFLGSGR